MTDTKEPEMTFAEWLTELNRVAASLGVEGKPIVEQTGEECWRVYYDDGYSPADALAEDWSYA